MKPTVVFQTDFGSGGGGVLAGVVKCVDAEVPVYDFDHNIEPYNVRMAAYQLSTVVAYWPASTVFVSVVDPGVGSDRRACVARLKNGSYVLTPDNGTLTLVADQVAEIREIDEATNRLCGSENVHIFHGRDIFAYTAARLAAGLVKFSDVGSSYDVSELVILSLTNISPSCGDGWAEGGIYNFDIPYGCARINIKNADFQEVAGFSYGDNFYVKVSDGERLVYEGKGLYGATFADVERADSHLVGDIQPGDAQLLRFNTKDNFLKTYVSTGAEPGHSSAVNYKVRFEKLHPRLGK